eukprot:TRINITY_DN6599_c0_g1_i1.p1 TRINITY_DN6599_c0_g1~~TRINITY_DN6599_c0_g1_i1.p1  ORF type:complete len:285 (-),score=29.18 TRINITY_DN6599_c0_g1_i1:62-826(-)
MSMSSRFEEFYGACNMLLQFFQPDAENKIITNEQDANKKRTLLTQDKKPINPGDVISLYKILDGAGIYPVIGGSISGMTYSIPRATKDCDLNINLTVGSRSILDAIIKGRSDMRWGSNILTMKFPNGNEHNMSYLKYNESDFYIFFNDNFATRYAIKNCRVMEVEFLDRMQVRVIPPESLCFFKASTLTPGKKRYLKDLMDLQNILTSLPKEEVEFVYSFVKEDLGKLFRGDERLHKQLQQWEDVYKNANTVDE